MVTGSGHSAGVCWLISAVLLQVGDQLLLAVQLVSQAADLLLVSFTVRVDLLLHRFLDTQKSENSRESHQESAHNLISRLNLLNVYEEPTFTSLAVWISFSFSIAWTFSIKHKEDSAC